MHLLVAAVAANSQASLQGWVQCMDCGLRRQGFFSGAQAQIEALINAGTKFSDIFEEPATKVADKESCPSGFTSINAGQAGANRECLKLKVLASARRASVICCALCLHRHDNANGCKKWWSGSAQRNT